MGKLYHIRIGEQVKRGRIVAGTDGIPLKASIDGMLRGLKKIGTIGVDENQDDKLKELFTWP